MAMDTHNSNPTREHWRMCHNQNSALIQRCHSLLSMYYFDITYDTAFLFVLIGKPYEEREPQSTRINKGELAVRILTRVFLGK